MTSENARDADGLAECFASDATVMDEVRAGARPGRRKQKTRRDCSRRVQYLFLAGPGAESAPVQSVKSLAGDPSEVTALGVRHWITSFRC
jgi:hypothetical protein